MASTAAHPPAANTRPQNTADGHGSKRGKAKKAADSVQTTTKQIEDTIAQLERNRAGDKEQELEIEREVKKANRDLSNLLSTMEAPMSRLETVQRKYSELLADMKRLEREHLKAKKRADQLQKEKDSTRSDLTKMTTAKDKLEKLCREMQKDNKKLKDDNRRLSENETRMREELHQRLEGMVGDVQEFISHKENPETLPANVESDELFRQKFKSFIDQYELRELQFHSLLRTKELEIQFCNARYEQQRKAQEQEATKSRQLTSQVSTFSQTETELRSQLNIYVDKFKQVEDTLNNSNDLFLTFRREMEEMSKKTKRLEKENHNLTRRHQATSENILQMAEERQRTVRDIDSLRRKSDNLERLCRNMQMQGRYVNQPGTASARRAPAAQLGNGSPRTANGTGAAVAAAEEDAPLDLLDEAGRTSSEEYDDSEEGSGGERDSAGPDLITVPAEGPDLVPVPVDGPDLITVPMDAPDAIPDPVADADDPLAPDAGDSDAPAEEFEQGSEAALLQAAAGAADLRSAVAATKAQRMRRQKAATANGQSGGKASARHVNGERVG